jgi:hypothetical protein
MVNPRTPLRLARISGRDQVAKARFKDRREPWSPPIGDPPNYMTCALQRDAWNQFRREVPRLCESHRALLEIACLMRARLARGEFSGKAMNLLRQCLTAMGAVPTSRVAMPVETEDPDDALFERRT